MSYHDDNNLREDIHAFWTFPTSESAQLNGNLSSFSIFIVASPPGVMTLSEILVRCSYRVMSTFDGVHEAAQCQLLGYETAAAYVRMPLSHLSVQHFTCVGIRTSSVISGKYLMGVNVWSSAQTIQLVIADRARRCLMLICPDGLLSSYPTGITGHRSLVQSAGTVTRRMGARCYQSGFSGQSMAARQASPLS